MLIFPHSRAAPLCTEPSSPPPATPAQGILPHPTQFSPRPEGGAGRWEEKEREGKTAAGMTRSQREANACRGRGVNEVKVLQSDQDSTGTAMRNNHLNPFSSLLFLFPFYSLNANVTARVCVFSRENWQCSSPVLGGKTKRRVPPGLAVDVSPPSGRARAISSEPHVIVQARRYI